MACETLGVRPLAPTSRLEPLALEALLPSRASELTGSAQTVRNELWEIFGVWVGGARGDEGSDGGGGRGAARRGAAGVCGAAGGERGVGGAAAA